MQYTGIDYFKHWSTVLEGKNADLVSDKQENFINVQSYTSEKQEP